MTTATDGSVRKIALVASPTDEAQDALERLARLYECVPVEDADVIVALGGDGFMIKLAGGEPANFLDIGGGASPERVLKAFRAVLQDKSVEVILVNIFAGINRCDWVAEGVVSAFREIDVKIPVVVRLAGTHVEEGRRIIAASGLPIVTADTLAEAATAAVAAQKQAE